MKIYDVRHKCCNSRLTMVTENYNGDAIAYCKKCHKNLFIPKKCTTSEFTYIEIHGVEIQNMPQEKKVAI